MAELTDDQITDAIAAEVVKRIRTSHPNATQPFMRKLVRLYTLQATGEAPPPGKINTEELATHLGVTPWRIREARVTGLARAKIAWRKRFDNSL